MSSEITNNGLTLTPFMPYSEPAAEEEEKKKKKKRRFFWIFFIAGFFVISFSAVAVGIYLKYEGEASFLVAITIDPIVVDSRGETHVNGGSVFSFNDTESSEHYLTDLEVMLSYKQYFIYKCTIENKNTEKLDMSFKVECTQITNGQISYQIDDGPETPYTEMVENVSIEPNKTRVVWLIFRIADMDYSSYIKGQLTLYINETEASS
ncbi:MAG: hypothetical protein IJS68_03750 [Clostridia bacterium]|nr:hypothetical protein [Clostridia bacterium]